MFMKPCVHLNALNEAAGRRTSFCAERVGAGGRAKLMTHCINPTIRLTPLFFALERVKEWAVLVDGG
jgi:hypothetical protein